MLLFTIYKLVTLFSAVTLTAATSGRWASNTFCPSLFLLLYIKKCRSYQHQKNSYYNDISHKHLLPSLKNVSAVQCAYILSPSLNFSYFAKELCVLQLIPTTTIIMAATATNHGTNPTPNAPVVKSVPN